MSSLLFGSVLTWPLTWCVFVSAGVGKGACRVGKLALWCLFFKDTNPVVSEPHSYDLIEP